MKSNSFAHFQLCFIGLLILLLKANGTLVPSSIDNENPSNHDQKLATSMLIDSVNHPASNDEDGSFSLLNVRDDDESEENQRAWSMLFNQRETRKIERNGNEPRSWAIPYRFGRRAAMPYRFGKRGAAAMHFRLGKKSASL